MCTVTYQTVPVLCFILECAASIRGSQQVLPRYTVVSLLLRVNVRGEGREGRREGGRERGKEGSKKGILRRGKEG